MSLVEFVGGKFDGTKIQLGGVAIPPKYLDVPVKGLPASVEDLCKQLAEDPNTIRYKYRRCEDLGPHKKYTYVFTSEAVDPSGEEAGRKPAAPSEHVGSTPTDGTKLPMTWCACTPPIREPDRDMCEACKLPIPFGALMQLPVSSFLRSKLPQDPATLQEILARKKLPTLEERLEWYVEHRNSRSLPPENHGDLYVTIADALQELRRLWAKG